MGELKGSEIPNSGAYAAMCAKHSPKSPTANISRTHQSKWSVTEGPDILPDHNGECLLRTRAAN